MDSNTKVTGQARDESNISLWQDTANTGKLLSESAQYTGQIFDTLIVGAGITGLTTALLLQKAGQKCIIAEAHVPGFGTKGGIRI